VGQPIVDQRIPHGPTSERDKPIIHQRMPHRPSVSSFDAWLSDGLCDCAGSERFDVLLIDGFCGLSGFSGRAAGVCRGDHVDCPLVFQPLRVVGEFLADPSGPQGRTRSGVPRIKRCDKPNHYRTSHLCAPPATLSSGPLTYPRCWMRKRMKAVRPGRAFGYFWQDKSDPCPGEGRS
jgi:hypothetical protein